ncbi:hypothetical protein MKEN_00553900 [Mycena kentingensis (nom. inval.)]|nr:hypothetical protein MKEN_00553900 [Mycena kentingensis (nom. inval.)]
MPTQSEPTRLTRRRNSTARGACPAFITFAKGILPMRILRSLLGWWLARTTKPPLACVSVKSANLYIYSKHEVEYDLGGLTYAEFAWDHHIYRSFFLSGLAILLYDHILVLDDEIKYIWEPGSSPGSISVYSVERRTPAAQTLVEYVERSLPFSCAIMEHVLEVLLVLQESLVVVTLFLRIFGMYGKKLWVLIPLWAIGNINLGLGVWTIVKYGYPRMLAAPGFSGCHTAIPHATGQRLGATWIAQMVSDTIIFGLTAFKAYEDHHVMSLVQSSLVERMAKDGAMYFGFIVLANLANVLTCFLGDILIAGVLSWWTTSLSVVLISRLSLNMQGMRPTGAITSELDSTEIQGIHFAERPVMPVGRRQRVRGTLDSILGSLALGDEMVRQRHAQTRTMSVGGMELQARSVVNNAAQDVGQSLV